MEELGYKIMRRDGADTLPVDFSVSDGEDNVAEVWGHDPKHIDWECSHPIECVQFDDDDETGCCSLCESWCDWHYEEIDDQGHKGRAPHNWWPRLRPGGELAKVLEEMGRDV